MKLVRYKVFPSVPALILLFIVLNAQAAELASAGKVVGISDGDTISVLCDGRAVKIRLHGIDCPEKYQPFGTAAKKFTSEQAFSKKVIIQPKTRDRYGRIVAEIILPDGTNLNQKLVSSGLAQYSGGLEETGTVEAKRESAQDSPEMTSTGLFEQPIRG